MKKTMILLTLIACALSASAGAADIAIVNAGFEDPVHGDGNWNEEYPGWSGINNVGEDLGTWNPDATGAIFYGYGGVAPEGQNVGWASDGAGLAQVLNETLTTGMTYTLSVEVGNNYYYGWAGYKVQLLAGGSLLAEDDSSVAIATDTFETSTVTYAYDSAHSGLLGQPLEIRLISDPGTGEADFDAVRLTAIPEPITLALLGVGGLALLRRKRK